MTTTPGPAGYPIRLVAPLTVTADGVTGTFTASPEVTAAILAGTIGGLSIDRSALAEAVLVPCSSCHGTGLIIDPFADVDPDPCLECEGAGAFDAEGRPSSCR